MEDWGYGMSEYDFHKNRSAHVDVSLLEKIALWGVPGKEGDRGNAILGSTYAPTREEIMDLESKFIEKREELDREAVDNDPEIRDIKNQKNFRTRLLLQNKRLDRTKQILAQREELLKTLDANLVNPPYHLPEDWDGDGILTQKDLDLALQKKILMDKLDRKQRDDRQDTVLLPSNQGIASFLKPSELGKLNQTSKIMKKETNKRKETYRHSSKKGVKDIKNLLDRLGGGIKKKSRRKRRKPKKRKTRRRKRKTRRRKRKTRKNK